VTKLSYNIAVNNYDIRIVSKPQKKKNNNNNNADKQQDLSCWFDIENSVIGDQLLVDMRLVVGQQSKHFCCSLERNITNVKQQLQQQQ
jgi:hypothetical protein